MWLDFFLHYLEADGPRARTKRRRAEPKRFAPTRLLLEPLDDRTLPSLVGPVSFDFAVGRNPNAVAVGEFNGDGRPDLAVANSDGNEVSVLLGNGDATFQPARNFATGAYPASVAVGDFNNDGKLDLATANIGGNDVSVLLGNGNGTFGAAQSVPLQRPYDVPVQVAVGDFNADGKMDLAVSSEYSGYDYVLSYVTVLVGNGDGTFGTQNARQLSSGSPMELAVADFDRDGKLDVATANGYYGTVSVLLGTGTGALGVPTNFYNAGYSPCSVAAGDMDGDGDIDLATANGSGGGKSVSVFLGNGTGAFGNPQIYGVGSYPFSIVLSDFNNDGELDIGTANSYGNNVAVLLGRGDGAFSPPFHFPTGSQAWTVEAGDFNGDGWLDAASANPYGNNLSVLINDQIWPPPDAPSVSINDVTVTEGNTGTTNATFTVSLSAAYGKTITVHYATTDGTASAGSDYTGGSGDLTFAPGQTTRIVTVAVIGDRLAELTESFLINLSAPTNATIADSQGIGTVLDDEPRITMNDVAVTEGNIGTVNATFTVSLSIAYDVPVTVHYATANGSATAGSDYSGASGDVTFSVGAISKTVTITVIGDRLPEDTETFAVNLSAATNAIIADGLGVGTILDDEPRISISDVTRLEGRNRQTTLFVFTVTLSTAYDQAVTMSYSTVNGTATTGDGDYVAKTGTLIFAPGETTKTITIEGKGDNRKETTEYFYLDLLGNSSNSLFTKNRGIGTILNDD